MKGVVAVDTGLLRGAEEGAVWVFRGVPYATVGGRSGRWRRPSPFESWSGVRDALAWGPISPQTAPVPGLSIPGDPESADEDCLNLNIWTPGLDDERRPVLVWIHGGGFTTGTGSSAIYRGHRLSERGDVVVVTINYRLGALGFLAHPSLTGVDGGIGNWGLHDQVAALEWLQRNIASFGGDPANVTVIGVSAGAMSICALMASSVCGRLFHRAVLQSGPPASGSPDWCSRRSERVAELAGIDVPGGFVRERLESLEASDLVGATQGLAREIPGQGGLPLPLLPVVDGGLIDRPPADAISDGSAATVPLLVGTTRDEATLFLVTDPTTAELDMEGVLRRIEKITSRPAAEVLVDAYRTAREARGEATSPRDILTAVTTDYVFRMPSLSLAAAAYKHQVSTYAYLFTWESPFLGGIFGSAHGLDMPFVFGTVEDDAVAMFSGSGPVATAISRAMQSAWVAFARSGDPSCDELGEWPAYDPLRWPTMVLGPERSVVEDPRGLERRAWDDAGVDIPVGHHHELRL